MEGVGVFACIAVGPPGEGDAHVTICLRDNCAPEKLQRLLAAYKKTVGPLLPIVMVIQKEVLLFGHNKDIPVHRVVFPDYHIDITLKMLYQEFYQQEPGKTPHPRMEAHISVDKPERKALVDRILEESHGVYVADTIHVKQIGSKDVIYEINATNQ